MELNMIVKVLPWPLNILYSFWVVGVTSLDNYVRNMNNLRVFIIIIIIIIIKF